MVIIDINPLSREYRDVEKEVIFKEQYVKIIIFIQNVHLRS